MGVQVSFNFQAFVQTFPEFNNRLTSVTAQNYWNLATTLHRNDGGGPVEDATAQTNLLNLATAHLAQLFGPAQPGGTTPGRDPSVVGRITNATEGSVSVATENQVPPGSAQWWNQTQYGAMYWLASAPYRTGRYMLGPKRPMNPGPFGVWPADFGSFGWW